MDELKNFKYIKKCKNCFSFSNNHEKSLWFTNWSWERVEISSRRVALLVGMTFTHFRGDWRVRINLIRLVVFNDEYSVWRGKYLILLRSYDCHLSFFAFQINVCSNHILRILLLHIYFGKKSCQYNFYVTGHVCLKCLFQNFIKSCRIEASGSWICISIFC